MRKVEKHQEEAKLEEHSLPSATAEVVDLLVSELKQSPGIDIYQTAREIGELAGKVPSVTQTYDLLVGHPALQEQMFGQLLLNNQEREIGDLIKAHKITPLLTNSDLRELILLDAAPELRHKVAEELIVQTSSDRGLEKEILKLMKREDVLSLQGDALEALRDQAGLNSVKTKSFPQVEKKLGELRKEYEEILGSASDAKLFVERLLEYPDRQFKKESHRHGNREVKPFDPEALGESIDSVFKGLDRFKLGHGNVHHDAVGQMITTLEKTTEYRKLPVRYQEALTDSLHHGVEQAKKQVEYLYKADCKGDRAEEKAANLLSSMRDLVKGYESSYKFSDADLKGRDFRVYLHDGRAIDIDVKASDKAKESRAYSVDELAQRSHLPPQYEARENGKDTAKIYSRPRLVVVNTDEPDEANIGRLREALR